MELKKKKVKNSLSFNILQVPDLLMYWSSSLKEAQMVAVFRRSPIQLSQEKGKYLSGEREHVKLKENCWSYVTDES